MSPDNWSDEFPTEPGRYWFYGLPEHGCMGMDYMPQTEPCEAELILVDVNRIGNGLIGHCGGRFVYSRKFNRERSQSGWLGWWQPAVLPAVPNVKMIGDVEIA